MRDYDVLVVGSGAAGQTVAAACARAGKRVAVADRAAFGGTCSLRGCVPKKVLWSGAETAGHAAMLSGKGIEGPCRIDWPSLMAFKRTYTEPTPARMENWMRDLGIETLHGTVAFISRDRLVLDGEELAAEAVVIATGARPAPLNIVGEEHVATSTDFLDLDRMPPRIAFIGGGYVSFELGGIARRAGAEVAIVHRSERVLDGFDPTLSDMLANHYRKMGVRVLTEAPVEGVERSDAGLTVLTAGQRVEADLVVHGAGRIPDLTALDLDAGGVAFGPKGVHVDRNLRSTTNGRVWAVGDASEAGAPLTPVAGAQGEVVAVNILGGSAEFDGSVTPSVAFTDPPLARVGIGAGDAVDGSGLERRFFDMSGWLSQTRVGNDTAGAVLVVDTATDTIRGAHLLGVSAEEVINIFTLAVRFGITVAELRTVTWTYPTLAYEINYLTGRY